MLTVALLLFFNLLLFCCSPSSPSPASDEVPETTSLNSNQSVEDDHERQEAGLHLPTPPIIHPSTMAEAPSTFERHPSVEALPVVSEIDTGRTTVILRGELSESEAEDAEELARAVYDDVNARFIHGEGPVDRPPIDLCVFFQDEDYEDFVAEVYGEDYDHSSMGFYQPRRRLILATLDHGFGNLRHELVHPLLGDDFSEQPSWLNEGMGSLYGSSDPRHGTFEYRVNYRLRDVHEAIEENTLPTFEELANSGRAEVYGPDSMTYYGMARYILFYLNEAGQLESFFREMWENPTPERQLELLETYIDYDAFVAWAEELEI